MLRALAPQIKGHQCCQNLRRFKVDVISAKRFQKPLWVQSEVGIDDVTARVDHGEPRRTCCAIVFHERRILVTLARQIVTKGDLQPVLHLVHVQLVVGVDLGSFKDRLDDSEPETFVFQVVVQIPKRWESARMTAWAPVLEIVDDLVTGSEVVKRQGLFHWHAISVDP